MSCCGSKKAPVKTVEQPKPTPTPTNIAPTLGPTSVPPPSPYANYVSQYPNANNATTNSKLASSPTSKINFSASGY